MLDSIISFLKYLFGKNKILKLEIKKIIGFFPNKVQFYEKALIHRSASVLNDKGKIVNNERLEYLGDAVLDVIIGDFLFKKYPNSDEGFLTQSRSKLVNRTTLYDLAKLIKLHHLIIMVDSDNTSKKNIYGDAFEAFIGALYLDKGFRKTYKTVINRLFLRHLDLEKIIQVNTNYKSLIIEWSQKFKKNVVFYTEPENEKSKYFISIVRIDNENLGEGMGISKKDAEQKAAHKALEYINLHPEIELN